MEEYIKILNVVITKWIEKCEENWTFITGFFAIIFFIFGFVSGSSEVNIDAFYEKKFYFPADENNKKSSSSFWLITDKHRKCGLAKLNFQLKYSGDRAFHVFSWQDLEESISELSVSFNKWDSLPKIALTNNIYDLCNTTRPSIRYSSDRKR